MKKKILIGRNDLAGFPELKLEDIEVKIDTGAFTSSFHCHDIELIEVEGEKKLHCYFLDPDHDQYHNKEFIFDRFSIKRVRSSNGILEERYSIETQIFLFDQLYPIELTLTERGNMKFPVLLGRKFLSKRFVVDSSKTKLSAKNKIWLVALQKSMQ
ncbi:ATP-dependent zinc protease family protein [Mangrovibacterium lignilyticum]|uniref:ATP-dependent zinc protease family protein n=1 Tax=Mangrovibacterium lignilyticum TaxID=2668052 RepID=UPI0013D286DD|nr:RimK/LysX family protein [Mangrovibacterium lignilyticum]